MLRVSPEVVLRAEPDGQVELPLAAQGVARWLWEGRYGAILVEVIDGDVFVNGDKVEIVGKSSHTPLPHSKSERIPCDDSFA